MKKMLNLSSVVTVLLITACGPSYEQKVAAEKIKADSIAAIQAIEIAEKAHADSLIAALAAIEKAKIDSIAKADSIIKEEEASRKAKRRLKKK